MFQLLVVRASFRHNSILLKTILSESSMKTECKKCIKGSNRKKTYHYVLGEMYALYEV